MDTCNNLISESLNRKSGLRDGGNLYQQESRRAYGTAVHGEHHQLGEVPYIAHSVILSLCLLLWKVRRYIVHSVILSQPAFLRVGAGRGVHMTSR